MEKRKTYGYIYLGTVVRYLIDASEGMPIFRTGAILENVINLRKRLIDYEFFVSARVGGPLWELAETWETESAGNKEDGQWSENRRLTSDEETSLVRTAGILRETLLAEAQGKVAFIASDKRYTVEKLLEDIGSLFGDGVFARLPDLAKFDFEEGGKSLAYELPTAAAFHILRGTEATLRDFYCHTVKRNRITEPRMWAGIVRDLRSKKNAPPELLLDNLDSLRSNFRNPTQHPEKTYDLDEAQDLLALAIDSINRMIRHQHSL